MSKNAHDEYKIRLERLKKIQEQGMNPYLDSFDKRQHIANVFKLKIGSRVKTAGRLLTFREMGRIAFTHLKDNTGKIQLVFKADELGQEKFKFFIKHFDPADFIGVSGTVFKTKAGELSILVKNFTLLSKALRPLPEKWHGLKDQELLYRQRYLDLITYDDTFDRFLFRSRFIKALRDFYHQQGFVELETPILTNTASGALATPFRTHHKALDIDVFLRIAPEIYLKEAVIGGFEKIFEIGRCFRNEGIDPSHLQDFTMAEHYAAYWNFEDNMKFTEMMFRHLTKTLLGTTRVEIKNRQGKSNIIDFKPPYRRMSFTDIIKKDSGIDIAAHQNVEELRAAIKKKKIALENINQLGRGNLIDALYKEVSRSFITEPTFVTHHAYDVSPLARRNDDDPAVVDRFQLVINGWEVVNAYSELIDPLDQAKRFAEQSKAKQRGDAEAHGKDDDYVRALEHGAPPMSGWGMGIDRMVALLTKQDNLRDVVLFPLLRLV